MIKHSTFCLSNEATKIFAYPLSPMTMFVVSAVVMVLATIGGVPHPIIARPVHAQAEPPLKIVSRLCLCLCGCRVLGANTRQWTVDPYKSIPSPSCGPALRWDPRPTAGHTPPHIVIYSTTLYTSHYDGYLVIPVILSLCGYSIIKEPEWKLASPSHQG